MDLIPRPRIGVVHFKGWNIVKEGRELKKY
jgi:hypothetical protein